MATIALFGATGRTGRQVLDLELASGHRVQALARQADSLTGGPEGLTVVQGDVLDAGAVLQVVTGADVVVSVFGHVKGSPARVQTDGTTVIVDAMQAAGVGRIVSLSGGGLPAPQDKPKLPDRLIVLALKAISGAVLADAVDHAAVLAASDLDWTIVRAPRLTDRPGRGTYRIGWVGVNASTQVSRADLAAAILDIALNDTYSHQLPFVSD